MYPGIVSYRYQICYAAGIDLTGAKRHLLDIGHGQHRAVPLELTTRTDKVVRPVRVGCVWARNRTFPPTCSPSDTPLWLTL